MKPPPLKIKQYILETFIRYWQETPSSISSLPIPPPNKTSDFKKLVMIKVPNWGKDLGINGKLLVPNHLINDAPQKNNDSWKNISWFEVMFWFIQSLHERHFEEQHGPIHSYSSKLKGFNTLMWQHAWANRIALFLRRWAAHQRNQDENILFGDLPKYKIHLTHDVDAIKKTFAIRIKQTLFCTFNSLRSLTMLKLNYSIGYAKKACCFLLSQDNYWCFDSIQKLEKHYNQRSYYHFYARQEKKNIKLKLLDPSYNIKDTHIESQISALRNSGHHIGLHQSFDNWHDSAIMKNEKNNLEDASKVTIQFCRQHWLRFSFKKTWKAQADAGFKIDFTLGFNDRAGFRNSSAIAFQPLDKDYQPINIKAIPTLFMDSHFFDYALLSKDERIEQMKQWINEVKFVHGEVAIIWHQRVFSQDYQWGDLYEELLKHIS